MVLNIKCTSLKSIRTELSWRKCRINYECLILQNKGYFSVLLLFKYIALQNSFSGKFLNNFSRNSIFSEIPHFCQIFYKQNWYFLQGGSVLTKNVRDNII